MGERPCRRLTRWCATAHSRTQMLTSSTNHLTPQGSPHTLWNSIPLMSLVCLSNLPYDQIMGREEGIRMLATSMRHTSYFILVLLVGSCAAATRHENDGGSDASPECDACDDSDVRDGADDTGTDAQPTEVELRGWRLEVDGQRLFFPESDIEEDALSDLCTTGVAGLPVEDAYWVEASQPQNLLALFPSVNPEDGAAGLVEIEGRLSPPGRYGPDGSFEQELEIVDEELLLCPTVSVLGHCAVPQPETRYACIFGRDPEIWDEGLSSLSDLFSFSVGDVVIIDADVLQTLEQIGDYYNMAIIQIDLESPAWIGTGPDVDFEVIQFPDVAVRELSEVHRHPTEGVSFEAQFTEEHTGWLMRRRLVDDGSFTPEFFLSVAGASLDGETIHVWASHPAMSTGGG